MEDHFKQDDEITLAGVARQDKQLTVWGHRHDSTEKRGHLPQSPQSTQRFNEIL